MEHALGCAERVVLGHAELLSDARGDELTRALTVSLTRGENVELPTRDAEAPPDADPLALPSEKLGEARADAVPPRAHTGSDAHIAGRPNENT